MTLLRIAEAFSRPLLFHPAKLEIILAALGDRLGLSLEVEAPSPEASRFVGRPETGRMYRSEGGVALIPIVGSLANRGAYVGASSGVVSYEGIGALLRQAAGDQDVHSVVLDINSGGGEATGMFRLAEQIRELRKSKRVVAYIDDVAASAAYGIASSASEIVVSESSVVGSIGVVLAHVDRSGEMEKAGRRVTLIHAGANKVDGHPFGPLSEEVRADLQAEILTFYDRFVGSVAAGRPGLTDAAIRATEARTYIGQDAVSRGLADRIASLDEVLIDLKSRHATRAGPSSKGIRMDKVHTAAELEAARAEGTQAGATAERNRIAGILTSEEGKKRPSAALEIALDDTALPVASATRILGKLPEDAPTAAAAKDPATVEAEAAAKRQAELADRARENTLGLAPQPQNSAPKVSGLMAAIDEIIAAG